MELQNFAIDPDGISLNWQGHNLDLHNCYDFRSLRYELALRQVELVWQKSPQPWAATAPLAGLRLVFKNVHFFRVKECDAGFPFTEDDCLTGVSFHPVELRNDFDSLSVGFSSADDLTFFFQSEWGIKLNADAATLVALD